MNTQKKLSDWLNSGEYQVELENALTKIIRKADSSKNESETANAFETEIYFQIRSKLGIELSIKKEVKLNSIKHKFELRDRKSGRGRLDAVINNLVIEYKHHNKLNNERQRHEAYSQVEDYLTALYKKENVQYDAILTDGIRIAYFQMSSNHKIYSTKLRTLKKIDLDKIIKAILNNEYKKFDSDNIVNDFFISPSSNSSSKKLAKTLFYVLINHPTPKTSMLYSEWENLMHLSLDDNGKSQDIEKRRNDLSKIFSITINNNESEFKAIYALQTTYAIIVKLIACRAVDFVNFNDKVNTYHDLTALNSSSAQTFFQKMEDGYSYKMGVQNFLEGDFFSWYSDEQQWNDAIFNNINGILELVDTYSTFSFNVKFEPIDVFKDLYMSIIPQSIRHSMGEYFTPEWLADYVVNSTIKLYKKGEWKAVDPCCGSGIFLVTLIKNIVGDLCIDDLPDDDKHLLLYKILTSVYGVDINPLSVLSARVSYYLAIQPLCSDSNVEIPVYLGDSALTPQKITIDNIPCFEYSISNKLGKELKIVFPENFVERKDFCAIMSGLQSYVKTGVPDCLYETILSNLDEKERTSKLLQDKIKEMCSSLVFLHNENWDGIWIRIAMNYMLIARMKDFNIIIGNPPWVKWEHLPSSYADKIKKICDIKHIFCNDGGVYGGAQLNICALISNVTATNWLTTDGILAFLMPDSIMSQNSYEEFRNFYIDYAKNKRMYLQTIDRWLPPLRPFRVGTKCVTQDFNTYYFSYNKIDYSKGISVTTISRKKTSDDSINKFRTFKDVEDMLVIGEQQAKQCSKDSTAFTYTSGEFDFTKIIGQTDYLYRTGVESTPFEIFKLLGYGKSNKKNHYRFKNKVKKGNRYKVDDIPDNGWDFSTKYIYPIIEGPSVQPFKCESGNNFHIIAYNEDSPTTPVPLNELIKKAPELAAYLSNHKNILDKQSERSKMMHNGEEFYALSKIGPYTFAPFVVAARDNTYFCSSVVKNDITPWGEKKKSICVKHTIIISQDINGNFISEDEAHYINGILNSSIVHAYIHNTFKTNGFSLNKSKLCLPKYDKKNLVHKNIVKLSKQATKKQTNIPEIQKKLTDLYIKVCEEVNVSN